MSLGSAEHIPPLPLVPYAVSLSLTVAYRVIRDRNFSSSDPDAISARANLTTRCEILETLSKRYWPADAMAKLGRKALASLSKPGVADQKSSLIIARQLDNVVAPCKHQGPGPAGTRPADLPVGSNALHVLSSAAAQYGEESVNGDLNANAVPLIGLEETVSGIYDQGMGSANTSANNYTPESFHNLDTLFDDFFDLSMPTFFEDPLFDGAAFGFDLPAMEGGIF
jgi:hypothetical protein